jgi:glutamate dehydrogenase
VNEELGIESFNKSKLGPRGVLMAVQTEEGRIFRNTMHNRVVADAFIPAGGRPDTINIDNWKQFLRADGTPTSSLIVEGANLFISGAARQKLFEHAGVLIVKDSSANKCGVICSSFEIVSSMLLNSAEFRKVKKELVADVLAKLRRFARMEAELLFRWSAED